MKHARPDYDQRIIDTANLIPEDEPVFLLRGQDKAAAATVREWAYLNEHMGGDPELSALAEKHADLMDEWKTKKSADRPNETLTPEDPPDQEPAA